MCTNLNREEINRRVIKLFSKPEPILFYSMYPDGRNVSKGNNGFWWLEPDFTTITITDVSVEEKYYILNYHVNCPNDIYDNKYDYVMRLNNLNEVPCGRMNYHVRLHLERKLVQYGNINATYRLRLHTFLDGEQVSYISEVYTPGTWDEDFDFYQW